MHVLALLSLADGIVALSMEIRRRPEIHRKQSLEATREAVLGRALAPTPDQDVYLGAAADEMGLEYPAEHAGPNDQDPGWTATNLQSHSGSRVFTTPRWRLGAASGDAAGGGSCPPSTPRPGTSRGRSYVGPDEFAEVRGYPTLVGRSRAALDERPPAGCGSSRSALPASA
jgi:hypothetical protein